MANSGNIFLVGPMGAGKTTVGKRLARLKGMRFVDSDRELERRTGVDIPLIFDIEGEAGFRGRESRVIQELTSLPDTVLATGGGAVLDPANRALLANRGLVVYLAASVEQQLERTRYNKNRPLLNTNDRYSRLRALSLERDPLYREIADLVMETHSGRARDMARRIARELDKLATTWPFINRHLT